MNNNPPNLSMCGCLLKCEKTSNPVPLKSLSVDVKVLGVVCDVVLSMKFENVEKNQIEAIYEFPLDDESVAYHFECEIDNRIIVAECQEKKQAKETYEEAIYQGHTATFAEQDDSAADIFRCKVGNLMPNTIAKVSMSYACELKLQTDGNLKFTLPTILNARYNPNLEGGVITNQFLPFYGMTVGQPLPYQFSFTAKVKSNGKILQITSARDKYNVSYDSTSDFTKAELQNVFVADHDIDFEIKYENPFHPIAYSELGKSMDGKPSLLSNDLVMLNFVPKFEDGDRSSMHEMIFVLDRSGSMQGSQMNQARETLRLMLKSLPSGCRFNIIGFGSSYQVLFEGDELSQVYNAESLSKASQHAEIVQADLGGTEILQPLQFIYEKPILSSHARQIILITDGEVSNTHQIIKLVHDNSHKTRVFTVGIGDGVSTSLIKGVARAGRGLAEFVKLNEKMKPIIIKVMKAAMQPLVTDVKIDIDIPGISDLKMIPENIGPIFGDDRMMAFLFLPAGSHMQKPGKAVLTGNVGTRIFKYNVDIPIPNNSEDNNKILHRIAINKEIKNLEERDNNESHKSMIVALSVATNIISKYTAQVGVDKIKNIILSEDLMKRNVPLMQDNRYFKCVGSRNLQCAPVFYGSTGPPPIKTSIGQKMSNLTRSLRNSLLTLSFSSSSRNEAMSYCASNIPPPYCDDYSAASIPRSSYTKFNDLDKGSYLNAPTYMDLVDHQLFNGSWLPTEDLLNKLNKNLEQFNNSEHVKKYGDDVWMTLLVLAALIKKYSNEKDEWEMVEQKSLDWLISKLGHDLVKILLVEAEQYI